MKFTELVVFLSSFCSILITACVIIYAIYKRLKPSIMPEIQKPIEVTIEVGAQKCQLNINNRSSFNTFSCDGNDENIDRLIIQLQAAKELLKKIK